MLKKSFKNRSEEKELIDDLDVDHDMLIENLKEFEMLNKMFGMQKALLTSLSLIYKKYIHNLNNKDTVIADVGCGGGDLLWTIAKWAKQKAMSCHLIGIDNNREIINYARQRAKVKGLDNNIKFEVMDVFTAAFQGQQFDIVCLNNVCHHFSNPGLVSLLSSLKHQVRFAMVINDLHRHFLAYYSIKIIIYCFRFTALARHDGPMSVRKAFVRNDFISLLTAAGITDYRISWQWPFRWQVILWCKKDSIC